MFEIWNKHQSTYQSSTLAQLNHTESTNDSACSVLFLSTTGLFPTRRKMSEHETQWNALTLSKVLENNPRVLKNSTEDAKPLFHQLIKNTPPPLPPPKSQTEQISRNGSTAYNKLYTNSGENRSFLPPIDLFMKIGSYQKVYKRTWKYGCTIELL